MKRPFLVLAVVGLLAACQSGEERAQGHYENALALMAEGDFDRARVEFLNVFQHDGQHRDARADFAAMQRRQGELQESYSQYLRLVEQYPDHVEGRIALAEMALQFGNWEEARRHGSRAIEEAPQEDPRIAVIALYLDYLAAIEDGDAPARREVFDRAAALIAEAPHNPLLRRLSIDHQLREGELTAALATIDAALEDEPQNRMLHDIRLSILVDLEREDAFEAQLITMLDRFPEDGELPGLLLRYYLSQGASDQAVRFLRDQAAAATEADAREDALAGLIQLLMQTEGPEAALAELDAILAAGTGRPAIFGALRASIRFEQGESDAALAELEEILEGELSVVETGQVRITLARMLLASGNPVGARAQVEQTLESDPGQSEALKMQAAWLIEEDEADRAIASLRTALETDPDDPQALTLMAQAHDRNGERTLAREFYALAVEASGAAPAETLRYVRILIEEDEAYLTAEGLLIDALRLQPGHPELMATLGQLYIRMEDWPRAEQVEASLREAGDETSLRIASGLEAQRLAAQGRNEEAIAFLESFADSTGLADTRAQIAVIRARLASGDATGAVQFAEQLAADAPDEIAYRFTLAATQSAVGDLAAAEAGFRALTEEAPEAQQAWIGLIRALNGQGREDEAAAVLDEALTVLPEALDLLWAQASFRERNGDYEGAIALYELMYERAPGAEVVANNLASLLSTYRDDEESLERAWAVARRLRGAELPPFQDTYGWLAYRRGEFQDALDHLEPAAAGMPDDPLVQYHLGMTYLALGRDADALAQLRRAVELAGAEDRRPQFAAARDEIARLEAEAAEAVSE